MEIIGNITTTESPLTVTTPALLNAGSTPSIQSDLVANLPTASTVGRIFIATDTQSIYRDTGSAWTILGGTSYLGTTNQITVSTNTIGIASNPVIPGTGALTLPSGTSAQRPTASAGLARYNSTTGAPEFGTTIYGLFSRFNGITRQALDEVRGKWKDDFLGGAPPVGTFTTTVTTTGAGSLGELGWTGLNSTASAWSNVASTTTHPGVLQMQTSVTNNSTSVLTMGNTATIQQVLPSNIEYFSWVIQIPTITTLAVRLGMGQSLTTANNGTDGIFFQFAPASSTNWQFITRSASTSTTLTSTVAVAAATWYLLEAFTDGTTWYFAINGVANATGSTTTIPTVAMALGVGMQTLAASARTLQLDYFAMYTAEMQRY